MAGKLGTQCSTTRRKMHRYLKLPFNIANCHFFFTSFSLMSMPLKDHRRTVSLQRYLLMSEEEGETKRCATYTILHAHGSSFCLCTNCCRVKSAICTPAYTVYYTIRCLGRQILLPIRFPEERGNKNGSVICAKCLLNFAPVSSACDAKFAAAFIFVYRLLLILFYFFLKSRKKNSGVYYSYYYHHNRHHSAYSSLEIRAYSFSTYSYILFFSRV